MRVYGAYKVPLKGAYLLVRHGIRRVKGATKAQVMRQAIGRVIRRAYTVPLKGKYSGTEQGG